jgi:hypothetical protein
MSDGSAEEDVGAAGADRAGHYEEIAGYTGGEKNRSAHPQ